ncbi:MAG: MerR family transcriptional regulator [Herpetosiphonaceae bacterium]|nr:MerR family transcriptional regulator [Herpetosiphonaceae bacterium]
MENLAIGEVARQAGIRTSAIRYYESIGLLPAPARVSGRRRYGPQVVQVLQLIQVAQQAGMSIAEINELFHGFSAETPVSDRWHQLAERKLREVEVMLQRAQDMQTILQSLLACRCVRLEDCLQGTTLCQPTSPGGESCPSTQ